MGEQKRRMMAGGPMFNNQQGQQGQPKIDLSLATQRTCSCGGSIFKTGMALFTVPAIVSPTGIELLVQQPVIVCDNCGKHVASVDELLFSPKEDDKAEIAVKKNSGLVLVGGEGSDNGNGDGENGKH